MHQGFSGKNLRGHSFKGQNLTGVNFSKADIRGADFTGANLTGANFSDAKAGLERRWVIFLVLVSWLLSALSGFLSALAGFLAALVLDSENFRNQIGGLTGIIVLVIFFFITIRQGIQAALGPGVIAVTLAVAVSLAAGPLAGGIAAYVSMGAILAVALAVTIVFIVVLAVAVAVVVGGAAGTFTVAVALAFTITGAGAGTLLGGGTLAGVVTLAAAAVAAAVAVTLVNIHISWRAIKGDEKHVIIRNIAVAFAASGGTSFRNANLTDANFTGAALKSTDFRKAILIRTCFYKTKNLDLSRSGSTYLQNAQVLRVLVTRHEEDKNFDRQDLRGVNFQGAYLVDASFIGADLSEANLQDADLSRAKLVQTQLDGTDFTGATLTGAIIEDWNITSHTKLHGVRCEYIYMRLPTKDNLDPLRKPDNNEEVFADGEFEDFIQPIFDTLDLYHNQGVDPRAIAVAFKELAEKNPHAALEIVAIERRGEDKILLRAKTAAAANKSELSKEYFINYNQLKALAEKDFKALIADKESHIRRLENMITTALERPNFYAETYNNQGDTTVTGDRTINTYGGNYNERIQRDYIQGNYYSAGQSQSLAQAAGEIQELLKQLEQTNPTTTTSQQMVVAAEVINRIESNPSLKKRVVNAVKEGGLAAFEKAIDNPAGAFIVGAIKGWQEVEAED